MFVDADFAARETMLRSTSGVAEYYGSILVELQIPSYKTTKKRLLQGHGNLHLDPRLKSWTNTNSRTLCSVPGADTVSGRARKDSHRRIATLEGRTPKVMLDWMFFTSDQEPGVQLPVVGCLRSFHWYSDGNAVNEGFVC